MNKYLEQLLKLGLSNKESIEALSQVEGETAYDQELVAEALRFFYNRVEVEVELAIAA